MYLTAYRNTDVFHLRFIGIVTENVWFKPVALPNIKLCRQEFYCPLKPIERSYMTLIESYSTSFA